MASKLGKVQGFAETHPLEDDAILTKDEPDKKGKKQDAPPEEEEEAGQGKSNASERINLQNIMELREAFDLADLDRGGALEL